MADETRPAWAQRLAAERQARGGTQQRTIEALRMQADHAGAARRPQPSPHVEELGARQAPAPARVPAAHRQGVRHRHGGDLRPRRREPLVRTRNRRCSSHHGRQHARTRRAHPPLRPRPGVARHADDHGRAAVQRVRCMPSADLRREGQDWLAKLVRLLDSRLTLAQHREVLVLAGWLALLVGCVEYDMARLARSRSDPPGRRQPR